MSVDASNALLSWYAVDKRALPWRAGEGEKADPYRVWLSEVMLQQTTTAAVRPYFAKFLARWPTVEALAAAEDADVMAAWAGLGYYARLAICSHARAPSGLIMAAGSRTRKPELVKLPGIGRYTGAAIAAIAFGRRAVVVDGNVERVVLASLRPEDPLPASRPTIYGLADSITPEEHCGDFAQAMMDLGATICTPRNPSCSICPLMSFCAARKEGRPEAIP
jgi:A/G-specific adenine glycosylase